MNGDQLINNVNIVAEFKNPKGSVVMKFIHERNRVYANDEQGKMIAEVTFPDRPDGSVDIDRTYVDSSLRGKGAASGLLEEAYGEIKKRGIKAHISCPYAEAWFKRNPEKADILV